MRLLVDEMPYYKSDCLFTEQKWNYDEETYDSYCKLTGTRCDLDEEQCSCLKTQGESREII